MEFDRSLAIQCVDSFARGSGLGCALSDAAGQALYTRGMSCVDCPLCHLMQLPEDRCVKAHLHGMREAERFGGKYIYFCPLGLTCFTSPLLGRDGSVAQLTAGPFLMIEEQDYAANDLLERTDISTDRMPQVLAQIHRLPYVEAERVTALSDLLFMAAAFINNAADTNRMMENQKSSWMQGQISDSIFRLKQSAPAQPYPFQVEKQFLSALSKGEQASAQRLLNDLLGHIMFSSGSDITLIRSRVYDLLVLMSRRAADTGGDPHQIFSALQEYRATMPQMKTVDEICLWLSGVVRRFMDAFFTGGGARHSDVIHRAIRYLQAHYMEKLTLDAVARSVYLSPTYLSRIFKQETGLPLMDFLNRLRIEKARELLAQENVRLVDVAFQCGFKSQSYFNRLFRFHCAMTPRQYRKQMLP